MTLNLAGKRITVVEVGPRDGLQNERALVSTADKVEFVNRLSAANLPVIEVSAFVSPKWVPQMADAAEVFEGITRRPGIRYTALVPNLAGLERAAAARVDEIAIFAAATDTFSRKNINQTVDESLDTYKAVCDRALADGLRVRGYLSTAFGCPYEGDVAPARVADMAAADRRPRRVRSRGERHDWHRASRSGPARARGRAGASCRPIAWRSTFTIRAGRRSPTCWPRCRSASRRSMPRPVGSAGARTRPAPPATWLPTI